MDYADLAKNLDNIMRKCSFIYKEGTQPSEITEHNFGGTDNISGENKVQNFEQRTPGSAGHNLKKWDELSVSEQKELVTYIVNASKGKRPKSERALAGDLILYTMDAPGYKTDSRPSPSELNKRPSDYKTLRFQRGYTAAFPKLFATVNNDYQKHLDNIHATHAEDILSNDTNTPTTQTPKKGVYDFLDALNDNRYDDALEIFEANKDNPNFLNRKDLYGNPLWAHVLSSNSVDLMDAFIKSGADLTAKDKDGQTPLHYALWFDNKDVLSELTGNTNAINNVVTFEQGGSILDLMGKGFDVNAQDNDGQAPLHRICEGKTSVETIEAFIQRGADVNLKDKHDNTPLDLVYKELNFLITSGEISLNDIEKYQTYIDVLKKHGGKNSTWELDEKSQKILEALSPKNQQTETRDLTQQVEAKNTPTGNALRGLTANAVPVSLEPIPELTNKGNER